MDLPDVNVLVYAHREDSVDHPEYCEWLRKLVERDQAFAVSDLVLSGFVRVVTNRMIFNPPTALETAIRAADVLRGQGNCVSVSPGPRHWRIFTDLCREADARGNLVSDAWLAALAIESGCDLVTTDRDFARFPGLRWRHPIKRSGGRAG